MKSSLVRQWSLHIVIVPNGCGHDIQRSTVPGCGQWQLAWTSTIGGGHRHWSYHIVRDVDDVWVSSPVIVAVSRQRLELVGPEGS